MIEYSVNYQHLAKGASRPSDDGWPVEILATSEKGLVLLPNIGDVVNIQTPDEPHNSFSGRVRSRLFIYINKTPSAPPPRGDTICNVNIVVEEMPNDEEWGKLIHE